MVNRLRVLILAVVACRFSVADIPAQYKSTVLVVQNDATLPETGTGVTGASAYVAAHYMAARSIPAGNLCHISIVGNTDPHAYDAWDISFADYQTYVETPIKACIT